MSIRQGSNILAGHIDYHPDLFDCKWSDHLVDNICWLRGDTFSWQDGTVYSAAYQHLVADMSDSPVQETAYATPNVSLIGTANVTPNGILQGFSTTYSSENSYATINPLSIPSSSLEMVFKLRMPPSYTVNSSFLLDIVSTISEYKGILIRVTSATNIRVYASSTGTSWDIMNAKDFTCSIPTDSVIWLKLTWNGSTYTLYTSTDGSTYTSIGTQSGSNPLYLIDSLTLGGSGRENYPFVGGKIDLKESYIKIDGSKVWSGANFITYTKTRDGHRIVLPSQINLLTEIYNQTGVAWYYVLDTTNTRFKLPRTKFGFNGLRDEVGKFIEPGSPEISGTFTIGRGGNSAKGNLENITGAFISDTYTSGGYYTFSQDANSPDGNKRAKFKASISNGIYGNSNTVQSPATQMYLYFYIGNFTQTAIENTAGLNTNLFNEKADVDLANITSASKISLCNLGMPGIRYDSLTLGVSGSTYTAPANGWFVLSKVVGGSDYTTMTMTNTTTGLGTTSNNNLLDNDTCIIYMPCAKGQAVQIDYTYTGTTNYFRFVYAIGEGNV